MKRWGAVLVIGCVFALWSAPAQATSLSASLTASNGEGTFDDTIACPSGDGPSWRYAYSGIVSGSAALNGTWNSTVEVHDAGNGGAFIPAGTGRIKISSDRGGDANLEFDGGDCTFAPLTLGSTFDGDPLASGSLPAVATGGDGTLRGFTGSGLVNLSLSMGPGADNFASINLNGDFTVTQPNMTLGSPSSYWRNLADFLRHRLTVIVPLRNLGDVPTTGDAYAVRLSKARLSGRIPTGGTPADLGRIDAGKVRTTQVTFPNAYANKTYTLKVWIDGTDSLDDPFPTVIAATTFKTPPPP